VTAPGDANDLRARLRRALPPAIKARDQTAVAALRSALAAIDNAEAVQAGNPPPPAPAADEGPGPTAGGASETPVAGAVAGVGAGEVERRRLTAAETEAIVRREVSERRTAARAYQEAGRPEQAERLRAEAELLVGYLGDPETPT
jgi:uncharacterized protein YqeY